MLRNWMFLAVLSLGTFAHSQSGWYRVRVDVPSSATLDRLENSDLNLMECVPHLGTTDVALGPGEAGKLLKGGYKFWYVGALEDPRDWISRHSHDVNIQTDDYRLHYFTADQILSFFESMRTANSAFVTRKQIGTTINGEAQWAYRVGHPYVNANRPDNNVVVEGLIHAREWITGSVVMHIANQCVDRLRSDPLFLRNQAVWIVPMANPDGYRYTWTNNRMWRKNRRRNAGGSYGVDLNRNYSKGWGLNGGSSNNQSSETYRGTAAFSEPESRNVRDLTIGLPRVGGFIDYHSYSQLILWPWGYQTSAPPDASLFNTVCSSMQGPMGGFGASYDQGQTANILYIASGTSNDYVYSQRAALAIAIELRDTGEFGFQLPENQILATQDEAWAGFQQYLTYMAN